MESKTNVVTNGEDYKERFKEEYHQTKDRCKKLPNIVIKYEAGTLDSTHSCTLDLLKNQKSHMGGYLYCFEIRAQIEGITL